MLKNVVASTLAFLLLISPAFAQDKFVVPKQTVTGAEEPIPANEIVILKVNPITDVPKYLDSVSYSWTILADGKEKKNVFIYPDNTTVGFGQGSAKNLQALLVINYLYVVRDKDDNTKIVEVAQKTSGIIFTDIKLGKTPPTPGPDNPPTPPDVNLPDGKFKLAKSAYDLALSKVAENNRVKGAQAISTSTAGIASSIRAGAIKDPTDALTKLKAANNSALVEAGINISEWDNFGSGIQTVLFKLYSDKKLNTISDYADAFDEIVTGLRQVK